MTNNSAQNYYHPDIETMSRDQLQVLQLERLRKTLKLAHDNIEHYQRSFKAAGIGPDELQSLEEFKQYPFTVADDLRQAYPFNFFAIPREQVVRIHTSSGSTGKSKVVGYSKNDMETWTELIARCHVCIGARPGDIFHNAYGYGLFTGGLGVHYGAERLGCTVIPASGGNTERQAMLLKDFGAHILSATPSYALNIAEVAEKEGIDLINSPLRLCLIGAEPCSEAMRQEIQQRLGVEVTEIYGLSEIMGPGVAVECTAHAGLHGWEDHFLFEIIDPETCEPLPFGEKGELVITTLTKEALPMIRYRTRDITQITDAPCACGRNHIRILRFDGRSDDLLIIRGVNVYPTQIEEVLISFDELAPHYQLLVSREGAMDEITVEVEQMPGFSGDLKQLASTIQDRIKSLIGISAHINIVATGEIPRSQGKAVRVRDLRKG